MVLKYLFSFLISITCVLSMAQDKLFFTDSYNTNLYKSDKNSITFSNNLFSILDEQSTQKVDSLFNNFFELNNIQIDKNYTKNKFQFSYNYMHQNLNYLDWSKTWFQEYESNLLKILNLNNLNYLANINDTFPSVYDAAIYKISANAFYNYKNRMNDATSTNISISSKDVNIAKFNKLHILPNYSLKRTITSGKNNFFNEAFYFKPSQDYQYFIISVNKKSRLIDCFSAHLFCNIFNIEPPVYLNNISYLKLNQLDSNLFNQEAIRAYFTSSKNELKSIINNSNNSFYNFYDLENLDHIIAEYDVQDLNKFIELYLKKNTVSKIINLTDSAHAYKHLILNDTINFKQNSYNLKSNQDSLKLASLALFLTKNPLREVQILGLANNSEYTKVDKRKYKELIKIYQAYSPIKVSKKINLPLYRSLLVFEYLFNKGVDPKTMICISKTVKNSEENLAFVYFNYKL